MPSSYRAMPASTTAGAAMHELVGGLFPICRSITGDGVRETLEDPRASTFR